MTAESALNTPESAGFSVVVIAPTYNNGGTLAGVLERIGRLDLPVIVVDDGCTDDTPRILREWEAHGPGRRHLRHGRNLGKAAALRSGFASAIDAGYTHAVTIDTDNQHDPEDIPRLIEAARLQPTALVLGARSTSIAGYPARSLTGRAISNLFIRLESGAHVRDSQSGLRVYPLGFVKEVNVRAGRYGFETEVLTRAAWSRTPIVEVDIASRYLPESERVSHFRPVVDTLRAIPMHARLIGRAMVPVPHKRWPPGAADTRAWRERIAEALSPRRVWRQMHAEPEARATVALGLAVGVFTGSLPLPGLHIPIALYFAARLHLHALPVLVGSAVATPPLGPILIVAGLEVGHLLVHGDWAGRAFLHEAKVHFWHWLRESALELSIGCTLVATLLACATYMIARSALRLFGRQSAP